MKEIRVLRLSDGDVLEYRALMQVFARCFEDPESYSNQPPSDQYVQRRLRDPSLVVLVALNEQGSVMAGLVAYELMKFEQERSEFYIYDLAVDNAYRQQGVATALIETVQTLAASQAGWVVFVQADYGDEPAINLYSKLGVREEVLHFDIPVKNQHKT